MSWEGHNTDTGKILVDILPKPTPTPMSLTRSVEEKYIIIIIMLYFFIVHLTALEMEKVWETP